MGRSFNSILMGWVYGGLLGVWFCAPVALAYPTPVDFDGSLLRWPIEDMETPVFYEVKAETPADLEDYETLVEEAAALWGHAGGSAVSYEKVPENGQAQVTVHLVRTLKDGAFASGYTSFDEWEGTRPIHCTIYILISEAYSYNGIAKTILHELGHGLGLGHTLIPAAIMSYSLDKNQFALDIDDEAALARLYPFDGTSPRLGPGCAVNPKWMGKRGGLYAAPHPKPDASFLFLLPLLLVWIRRAITSGEPWKKDRDSSMKLADG